MTDPAADRREPSAVAMAARLLGPMARIGASLGSLTTYRVGGPAAVLAEPRGESDLALVSRAVRETGLPVLVVGKGSNMLVADAGFPGLAVVVGDALADLAIEGTLVRAGGGASLPVVARRAAAAGLTGFEWAVGVPGSIGGAVRMNAGGHGSDMAACLVRARVFDLVSGVVGWRDIDALGLAYRTSNLTPTDVVVEAEIRCEPGDADSASAAIAEIVRWRRANQPGGQNAGSVFANPPGDAAGRLIEEAGLRGFRMGTAEVSPKHANFIQADDGGSADDVKRLIDEVRARVRQSMGVELRTEVRLIGFELPYPQGMTSRGDR